MGSREIMTGLLGDVNIAPSLSLSEAGGNPRSQVAFQ
jgi:hypothetical protein